MPLVSVTRLRVRSMRFLPAFLWDTYRTLQQVKAAAGFREGAVLTDRSWTFWTMTVWDGPESMRGFMSSGAHKEAMPKLMEWCDEASVAHWEQAENELPAWTEADARMRQSGRASKVRRPSAAHAGMQYREPRVTAGRRIERAKR